MPTSLPFVPPPARLRAGTMGTTLPTMIRREAERSPRHRSRDATTAAQRHPHSSPTERRGRDAHLGGLCATSGCPGDPALLAPHLGSGPQLRLGRHIPGAGAPDLILLAQPRADQRSTEARLGLPAVRDRGGLDGAISGRSITTCATSPSEPAAVAGGIATRSGKEHSATRRPQDRSPSPCLDRGHLGRRHRNLHLAGSTGRLDRGVLWRVVGPPGLGARHRARDVAGGQIRLCRKPINRSGARTSRPGSADGRRRPPTARSRPGVNVGSVFRAAVKDRVIGNDPTDAVRLPRAVGPTSQYPRPRRRKAAQPWPTNGSSHSSPFCVRRLRKALAAGVQLGDVDFSASHSGLPPGATCQRRGDPAGAEVQVRARRLPLPTASSGSSPRMSPLMAPSAGAVAVCRGQRQPPHRQLLVA